MKRFLLVAGVLALTACGPAAEPKKETKADVAPAPVAAPAETAPIVPMKTEAPAGTYKLDKAHASLDFRVSHIGFSNYTARFASFDAELTFDPANPGASSVTATIDPRSLTLPTPPKGFLDELLNDKWLGAAKFPRMTFKSTKVELTGANTARITGDLTLKGATVPVTLDATFNGGYAGHPYDPAARIGFSAKGSLKRTAFGVSEGVPAPGSTMGVSDDVEIIVEAEFNGPPKAP
ncbi:MAG: polyisoprenoid-binding protein [Alphaproteobacteria bacterium]|nr:polyisoprenoid-binding protein [Alphaproteobacteria bacterium]